MRYRNSDGAEYRAEIGPSGDIGSPLNRLAPVGRARAPKGDAAGQGWSVGHAFERWIQRGRHPVMDGVYHIGRASIASWSAARWIEPDLHWGITWAAVLAGGVTWHLVDERLGRTSSVTGLLAGFAATALGAAVAATVVTFAS